MTVTPPIPPTAWHQGNLLGLDTETTGTDTATDRAVTVTLTGMSAGFVKVSRTWIIDPGVEIPEHAAELHGVTTERARAEGWAPADALEEIRVALGDWNADTPLVAYNAAYDLSLLDAEFRRHLGISLWHDCPHGPVIDPLVTDRWVDRYRRGGRKLADVAAHYRVELKDAHTSEADTAAALGVAVMLAHAYPRLVGDVPAAKLHEDQRTWHRVWSQRMAKFLTDEVGKMDGAAAAAFKGSPRAQAWVRAKLTKLELLAPGELVTRELVDRAQQGTRERAADFAASASEWPVKRHVLEPVTCPQGVDAAVDSGAAG